MILAALALAVAAPACEAYDTALPRALAGWTRTGRRFDTGHSVTLPRRNGTVRATVRIRRAGIYGVALDSAAWIDVYPERGKALRPHSEPRVPACSTIRKIVRYRLRPGAYRVEVTRLKGTRARLMLVRY